jgi:uncharacterized membrane protein YidH (DUF202 family)
MTRESDQSPAEASIEAGGDPDLRIPGALVRTALSSEQTLLSWVRTTLSLITFGFTITQIFHYLEGEQQGADLSTDPRRLGMALICVGVLVLAVAVVEHVLRLRKLKNQGLPTDAGSFLPLGSAVGLIAIGVVALVSVFMKWNL